jgi:hypothetical protein
MVEAALRMSESATRTFFFCFNTLARKARGGGREVECAPRG